MCMPEIEEYLIYFIATYIALPRAIICEDYMELVDDRLDRTILCLVRVTYVMTLVTFLCMVQF